MADIYVLEDPQDKPFAVLSFSRQTVTSLGFTSEQMSRLTDEDMERIAASLVTTYPDFMHRVRLNVTLYLASYGAHSMTDWAKPFPVGSVYRYDLQRIGLTNEQIDQLSDIDLLKMAQKMQNLHLQGEFWKHLAVAVGEVLQEKEAHP